MAGEGNGERMRERGKSREKMRLGQREVAEAAEIEKGVEKAAIERW